MITGYLDEVFIKEMNEAGTDMVYIVRNLPKALIYQEVAKRIPRVDREGYMDGSLTVDPSGAKVEDLKEGLEHSRNGDGSIVFVTKREPGRDALEQIDRYIAGTLPRDVAIPKRVPYPMQVGDMRSMPKPKHMIPAIDLPKPIDREVPKEISPAGNAASPKASRVLTPEQKAKQAEILAKARAARAAKRAQ